MWTIYKYTSPSKKYYIGITSRTKNKRANYNGNGYDRCPAFWRAIQKYGFENFQYEILETGLTEKEAKEKEQYYINFFDTTNPNKGYNISKGGDGYTIYNKELIVQLWNEGKSVGEIIEEVQCDKSVVQQTLTKNNISIGERVQRGIDKTEYNDKLKQIKNLWEKGKTVKQIQDILSISNNSVSYALNKIGVEGEERIKRSAGKYRSKTVYQYNKNKELIKSYSSVSLAEKETLIPHSNIVKVCNGERKSAGGFIWSYDKLDV